MDKASEIKNAFECACMLRDSKFGLFSDWEQGFIMSCILQYERTTYLSDKQVEKLNEIYDKNITGDIS